MLSIPFLSQTLLKSYLISKGIVPKGTDVVSAVIIAAYMIGLGTGWVLCKIDDWNKKGVNR